MTRWVGRVAVLFPALLAVSAAALACARPSGPTAGPAPGDYTRTLTHDGLERSYILHVPPALDPDRAAAVVLVFHGGGGNARNAVRMTGFDAQSDVSGFVAVYPDGAGRFDETLLTWNGGECCGYAQEHDVDDVGFVRALLEDLETVVRTDPKRIYATGMSNGAIFSYRLACEMSDVLAAIGPVAGTQNIDCQPSGAVSVIHFHGTGDQHLPYEGGVGAESLTGVNYTSVAASLEFWANHNQCAENARRELSGGIEHLTYAGCAPGTAVELYTVLDGLHAWPGSDGPGWPGGDIPTAEIDATSVMWEFFEAHPKP